VKWVSLIVILFFTLASSARAQYQGAVNSSMGVRGVSTANLFSVNINPANLSLLDSSQIGLSVRKWQFTGPALESGLQFASPIKNINLGLGVYNFGNRFYNFGKINVAIAKALDNKQGIGVSVDYYREFVYLNGDARALNAILGYYYKFNPKVNVGASVRQVFYRSDSRLERSYSQVTNQAALGLTLRTTEHLSFTGEFVSDEINALGIGFGMQFNNDKYALLMGLSNQENMFNAGLQIPLSSLHLTLAYAFHQQLGSSVQSLLTYSW